MKNDIFISYSRRDSAVVDEFVSLMEGEGFRVWIDRDGIESGDAFKKVIVRAIKESALVVFFSSESSNASSWTAKEISVAVHHAKPIIPIKIDNTVYNDEVEFDLVSLDYIDYTNVANHEAMKSKLLRTLRTKMPERWKEICAANAEAERQTKETNEKEKAERERLAKEEAERKAKEASERERLEREHKAEEAKRKAEQERRMRERAEAQRRAEQEAEPNLTDPSDNAKPKPKKGLWIGLGAAAVVVLLLVLLLKPKKEPLSTDPDTQAYQTCQTIEDYRAYIRDYGRNASHYTEAKAFVDQYVADSLQLVADSLAQAQRQQLAQQQAEAERKEDGAYRKCTTISGCNSYLKTYPNGRYADQVRAKKAELEQKQTQQQTTQNTQTVGSGTSSSGSSGSTGSANDHEVDAEKKEDAKTEVFRIADVQASFPGGEQKLIEFVARNVKYPQLARETGIQGRVFVSFIVEPDGSISDVSVLRGIGGGCDEEAVRVVKSMPKWNPAKCRGEAVRSAMQIPISFKLK